MEYGNDLKLVVLNNFKEFGEKVNKHIQLTRRTKENYIVSLTQTRFDNGEGKMRINESLRGKDVYILSDVSNWSETYMMHEFENHKSPDDHMQDIRRVIYAMRGHAQNITLIMPYMYQGRQDSAKGRESLDCANTLQELRAIGVNCILTYDNHNPKMINAVPLHPFDNLFPRVNIMDELLKNPDFQLNNVYVVSPDIGAMERAREYANILKTNVGFFQKRRDLTKTVDGVAPIIEHKYTGDDIKGKDVVVVDDMISSGGSILEVGEELHKLGARKVHIIVTFALFTKGCKKFDEAFEKGYFDTIYTSNLNYMPEEFKNKPWIKLADSSKHVAKVIHTLNIKDSISPLMDGSDKIVDRISKYEAEHYPSAFDFSKLTPRVDNKKKIGKLIEKKRKEKNSSK